MIKHLLVPLDGSRLAESALPVASLMAQTLHTPVTLIHMIERNAPQEIHSDRHLTSASEATAYLKEISDRAFPAEVEVNWHVHTVAVEDVAHSILDHAEELDADLVIMCTHGRGGPRDWFIGSIAQQMLAIGSVPILLIPPSETGPVSFRLQRALVTLDGAPEHEQGLPVAVELAEECRMSLHLLMVIPTLSTVQGDEIATATMLPGAMRAYLDLAEQGGKEYLGAHLARLRQAGLDVSAEVARGDPLKAIVNTAQRIEADLIVMGTHGKTGMEAFWSGSLTPKVSSKAKIPLLLAPVGSKLT
jgi:nucleotide-binding universal stress UspA family protein